MYPQNTSQNLHEHLKFLAGDAKMFSVIGMQTARDPYHSPSAIVDITVIRLSLTGQLIDQWYNILKPVNQRLDTNWTDSITETTLMEFCPTFRDASFTLSKLLNGTRLVGHNPAYMRTVLEEQFKQIGGKFQPGYILDTTFAYPEAIYYTPERQADSLDISLIDDSPYHEHASFNEAQTASEIFLRLAYYVTKESNKTCRVSPPHSKLVRGHPIPADQPNYTPDLEAAERFWKFWQTCPEEARVADRNYPSSVSFGPSS